MAQAQPKTNADAAPAANDSWLVPDQSPSPAKPQPEKKPAPATPAPPPASPAPAAPATANPPAPATPAKPAATQPAAPPPAKGPVNWTQTTAPRDDYDKSPDQTLILNPEIPFYDAHLSTAGAVSQKRHDGFTRFMVNEPGQRFTWSRNISAPVLWEKYPYLILRYRVTGIDTESVAGLVWMDDGYGGAQGGVWPFMYKQLIADGNIHELRADMRLLPRSINKAPGTIMGDFYFSLVAAPGQNLVFDFFELRCEADPEKPNQPTTQNFQANVKVIDAAGKPVVGAIIRPSADWLNLGVTAKTDSKGEALIKWVSTEGITTHPLYRQGPRTNITATKPGYTTARYVSAVPVPFGTTLAITPTAKYSGLALDEEGKSIPGASFRLRIQPTQAWAQSNRNQTNHQLGVGLTADTQVIADDKGRWETDPLPSLNSNIEVSGIQLSDPRYLAEAFTSYTNNNQGPTLIKEFRQAANRITFKRGAKVSGRVLDKDNKPIRGAQVTPANASAYYSGGFTPVDHMNSGLTVKGATTDQSGHYSLGMLPVGSYNLKITSPRHITSFQTIGVKSVDEPVFQDFNLETAIPLRARVLDKEGKPFANAYISIVSSDQPHQQDTILSTNADGRFNWSSAPKGLATVLISKQHPYSQPLPQVTLVQLKPIKDEYTIKLLDNGQSEVSPVVPETQIKPIPAPTVLREPPPGRSVPIDLTSQLQVTSHAHQHGSRGNIGAFAGPGGVTALWRNGNLSLSGFVTIQLGTASGVPNSLNRRLVLRYKATTQPAAQPDMPMFSFQHGIGLKVGRHQDQKERPDFVPDGKTRELVIDLPPGQSLGEFLVLTPIGHQSQRYGAPTRFQDLTIQIEKAWIEADEPDSITIKPFDLNIVAVDNNGRKLPNVSIYVQGATKLLEAVTNDQGAARIQGEAVQAAKIRIVGIYGSEYGLALVDTDKPDTGKSDAPIVVKFDSANPPDKDPAPARTLVISGKVTTDTGPAANAIVWLQSVAQDNFNSVGMRPITMADDQGNYRLEITPILMMQGQRQPDVRFTLMAQLGPLARAVALEDVRKADQPITRDLLLKPMVKAEYNFSGVVQQQPVPSGTIYLPGYEPSYFSLDKGNQKQHFSVPLILGDVVSGYVNVAGYQRALIRDVVVKENMPPIDIAMKQGYKAKIVFKDEDGKPLPQMNLNHSQFYSAVTNGQGEATLTGLSEGTNTLQAYQLINTNGIRQYQPYGAHKFEIKPGDVEKEQLIELTIVWPMKLIAVDKETLKPIEGAYTYRMPVITSEDDAKTRTDRYAQIEELLKTNPSYANNIVRKLTEAEGAEFMIHTPEAYMPVYAPGYQRAELHVKQSDPKPRVYTVKLEKQP